MTDKMKRSTFTTVSGLEVEVEAVSYDLIRMATGAVEKRYREAGEPLDPPTYEVETIAGDKEIHPHVVTYKKDDKGRFILEDDKRVIETSTLETNEDREAWEKHETATERMQAEQRLRETQMTLEGVIVKERPEWVKRSEKYGIPLPADQDERREHFLNTEVLRCPEDYVRALGAVQALSLSGIVPEDEINALMDSFRGYISEAVQEARNAE